MIRILLVDDQALLCEVLKTWLEVEEDFEVAGVAHNGEEAIVQVETLQPDIILMDIDMPHMNGIEATELISDQFPHTKVIFLSAHDDDIYLHKSLQAGAKGYLLKNTTAEELAEKIRSVHFNTYQNLPINEENIAAIQRQLEDLIQTYQAKFQQQLETAQLSLDNLSSAANSNYEQRIHNLEIKTKNSWESIHQEVLSVKNQLSEANRHLDSHWNQQVNNLKTELDSQLDAALADWSRQRAALQEWAVQRDEMHNGSEDWESKYRREMMMMLNPLRASIKDLDRQLRVMRTGMISAIFFAAVSLSFAGWLLWFNLGNNTSTARQLSEQLESYRK